MSNIHKERTLKLIFLVLVLCIWIGPARADVIEQESSALYPEVKEPVYQWKDDKEAPRAIVLAVHGATLHGGSYDSFGRLLAQHGYLVLAPDMHGFGHFYHDGNSPEDQRVIYDRSEVDFVQLLQVIKKQYPELPIICAGESTGAQLAVRLAANHPELINGIILSSTSPHASVPPVRMVAPDLTKCLFHPRRQVDLNPYITLLISDDPKVAQERVQDPMGRNRLSLTQLLKILWMSRRTLDYAENVPPEMPVLALQGTADHLFKPEGVSLLLSHMKSQDKKLHWFENRGHILLETKYMQPDTADTVLSWLDQHTSSAPKHVASSQSELEQPLRD